MNPDQPNPDGWLASLRRIGDSLLALLRNRFELFTVELQEEKLRLLNLLVWLGVAAAIGAAGLFIALLALAFWLWNLAGYAGVMAVAGGALAAAAAILWRIDQKIRTTPPPFAQTVAELRKDAECLQNDR